MYTGYVGCFVLFELCCIVCLGCVGYLHCVGFCAQVVSDVCFSCTIEYIVVCIQFVSVVYIWWLYCSVVCAHVMLRGCVGCIVL